jgi:hypothetical protein
VSAGDPGGSGSFERMLHVATVHWQSDAWISVQLRQLQRFAPRDTKIWACLNGIADPPADAFYRVVDLEGSHPQKLNLLAEMIGEEASADDHILFLDGDAFPVAPLDPLLAGAFPLSAVRRDENFGDPQPHPCFCMTTVGFWRDVGGDWRPGFKWRNTLGVMVTDPGAELLRTLEERNDAWRPLVRQNTVDLHPVWFALYGDDEHGPLAYHHGAGFRGRVARVDTMLAGFAPEMHKPVGPASRIPGLRKLQRHYRGRQRARRRSRWEREEGARQQALADEVFQAILDDADIVERFRPRAGAADVEGSTHSG